MLFEAEFAKETMGVRRKDFPRRMIRIQSESDRHKASDQVRIAVAAVAQRFFARGVDAFAEFQPDLADAAPHLVGVVVGRLAQRVERAAKLENIAVAILPIVEKGKIAANGLWVGQGASFAGRSPILYRHARTLR
jgi:hypothetical protein